MPSMNEGGEVLQMQTSELKSFKFFKNDGCPHGQDRLKHCGQRERGSASRL